MLVTDGVTEAENAEGDFFDNERLEIAAKKGTAIIARLTLVVGLLITALYRDDDDPSADASG